MGWQWPLVPGIASSKSGTEEAGEGEVKGHEDNLAAPSAAQFLEDSFKACSSIPLSCHSHPVFSFEDSGEHGECAFLGGSIRDTGRELPYLLPWPPRSTVLTASPI